MRLQEFVDIRQMYVARLSALHTGHLYLRGYPWNSFLTGTDSHSVPGNNMSMNIPNNHIAIRTCDRPDCSAGPQPTAQKRVTLMELYKGLPPTKIPKNMKIGARVQFLPLKRERSFEMHKSNPWGIWMW